MMFTWASAAPVAPKARPHRDRPFFVTNKTNASKKEQKFRSDSTFNCIGAIQPTLYYTVCLGYRMAR